MKNYIIPTLSKLCFKNIYKKAKTNYINSIKEQLEDLYNKQPINNINMLCIVADYEDGCCCRIYDKNEEVISEFVIYLESYMKAVKNKYCEIENKCNSLINEIKKLKDNLRMVDNESNKKEIQDSIYKNKNIRNRSKRELSYYRHKIQLFKDNEKELSDKIRENDIKLVALGNGSFSGEVEDILKSIIEKNKSIRYEIVDELIKERKNLSSDEKKEHMNERNRSIFEQLVHPFNIYSKYPLEALHYYDNNSEIISEKKINKIVEEVTKNYKNDDNNKKQQQQQQHMSLIPKNLDGSINATIFCKTLEGTVFNLNLPISGIYHIPPFYKKYIKYLFQKPAITEMQKQKDDYLDKLNTNYIEYIENFKRNKNIKMTVKKVTYKSLHLSLIEDDNLLEKRRISMKKRYLYENIPYYTNLDESNQKIVGKVVKKEKNYCLIRENKYGNTGILYKDDYNSYELTIGEEREFNIIFSAVDQIKLVRGEKDMFDSYFKSVSKLLKMKPQRDNK